MKQVLAFVLVAVIAFTLGHFPRAPIPQAGAAGGLTMPVSGDANGDHILDIADAVYIIDYQLRGGPAPVPIEWPLSALPATGQTKCYDNAGSEIDCGSADFPGQDGFYKTGCPSEGRFVDHEDGTVTDTCTGLMWQKDTADVSGDGTIGGADLLTWQGALKYCDSLRFAGHDDWRLPNVRELQSIVDYGRWKPAIDPVFGAESAWYWSSTSHAGNPGAWFVYFYDGYVTHMDDDKVYVYFVRAVRAGP